jgi:membrane protein YqaA with SNARE-associated domain
MRHFRDLAVSWGPLGIFLFAVIDSLGVPNPGGTDALLIVVSIADPSRWWLGATLAIVGSLLGSVGFLEITRRGGERYLLRFTATGRGLRFRAWFVRYGLVTVFIPALLPIPFLPFKLFAACAGAMSVSRTRYLLVIAAARIPRYLALAYLGATLGENSGAWLTGHAGWMAAFAIALFIALYALIRFADRTRDA